VSQPERSLDVRVGSSTDGLTPISAAERSLGAGAMQWVGLAAIARRGGGGSLTKRIV
jgi:hypothetical protein